MPSSFRTPKGDWIYSTFYSTFLCFISMPYRSLGIRVARVVKKVQRLTVFPWEWAVRLKTVSCFTPLSELPLSFNTCFHRTRTLMTPRWSLVLDHLKGKKGKSGCHDLEKGWKWEKQNSDRRYSCNTYFHILFLMPFLCLKDCYSDLLTMDMDLNSLAISVDSLVEASVSPRRRGIRGPRAFLCLVASYRIVNVGRRRRMGALTSLYRMSHCPPVLLPLWPWVEYISLVPRRTKSCLN